MSQIAPQRPPVQKSAMPRRRERKHLDSFRDEKTCWGCGLAKETIVPCHLNSVGMGHGVGIKTRGAVFPGCATCHDIVDRRGAYSHPKWDGVRWHIIYRVAQVALMELARRGKE